MRTFIMALGVLLVVPMTARAQTVDLVVEGQAKAVIVALPTEGTGRRGFVADDMAAAQTLVTWIEWITGVRLPVVEQVPAEDQPAIVVGRAAIQAGLSLDDIKSESSEGLKVVIRGRHVLLAGQNEVSTVRAACRLLESLGCRFLFDHPLGQVHPRTGTLRVADVSVSEKPGTLSRRIWGSSWNSATLWGIWNGAGGLTMNTRHAWSGYIDKEWFNDHPELFALRAGERKAGGWVCTTNAELTRRFAANVAQAIADGDTSPSVSPPDGVAYCECQACTALDDPDTIEPSSGRVAVTNRYLHFLNDVATQVAARYPDSLLNFYVYADYTQAPSKGLKAHPNLVPWIAPIRYSRHHRIGHPLSSSMIQFKQMLDGWDSASNRFAYRGYNLILAECYVPFSKISIWAHDIPYLASRGCVAFNLETLNSWYLYAPHVYQSIRLAYDPNLNSADLMHDYYRHLVGAEAASMVAQYWQEVDDAYNGLATQAGSFYVIPHVFTPERNERWMDLLQKAHAAASEERQKQCVEMFIEGLTNAVQYMALRNLINQGDIPGMTSLYQQMVDRATTAQKEKRWANHYTIGYLERFVGKNLRMSAQAAGAPHRLVAVLPDQWRFRTDPGDEGVAGNWMSPDHADGDWRMVKTFGDTLDGQGLPDEKTVLWYRTKLTVPEVPAKSTLVFFEIDGVSTVYVNGKEVGGGEKARIGFEVDVTGALRAGENTVAVRVDHSRITELFLGGIIRPVYLVAKSEP